MRKARFLLLISIILFSRLQAIDFAGITCDFRTNPLAVNTLQPLFGWQMSSTENGSMQSGYEMEVIQHHTGKMVWKTGMVNSTQSQLVQYQGQKLLPGRLYAWRVRIRDERNIISNWSDWQTFRMAPDESMLQAKWIGAIRSDSARLPVSVRFPSREMRTPEYRAVWEKADSLSRKSILLRKSFRINKEIKEAIVYIGGYGHYEFTINGKKVGDELFAPLWSDYDKTLYYNTFDITNILKKGENAFGVMLGNGFYNVQGGRYIKLRVSFGAPALWLKTIIQYQDGSKSEIIADESWKWDLSPVTYNDIYGGESYDARLEQQGWNQAGFNEKGWKPVVLMDAPKGKLTAQTANPVKIMQYYGVKSVKKLTKADCDSASKTTKRKVDASAFVLDMGQNLSGFPEIKIKGKKGDKITLIVAEALTVEGAANQNQSGRPHYYEYTLKGEGIESWHPRFSYYGFRYIQVEGAVMKGDKNPDKLPVVQDIKSCFVYNSAPGTSTFSCSNELFNKTHILIGNAIKSNMHGVFTDCPHREKLGWIEQLHLNGPVVMYNYDVTSLYRKIQQDMVDAQLPDGMIPSIAPEYNKFGEKTAYDDFGVSPEWGSSAIIVPWMYNEFYGDSSLIVQHYQTMRRWMDYLTSRAENHVLSFGLGDWYDYGDYKAGFARNTPVNFVATAYYYYATQFMVKSARMVDNQFDANYYAVLGEKIRNVLNTRFYNPDTGQYSTGSQTANALAIYMNFVRPENKQQVLNNLVEDIKKHGNRLTTGDIGNRYLFQTIATNGLNDLLYQMFNHEEAPGYGFQLKFGATTLTEQWDPRKGASWNHFMMGQIDEWFFASLAGIKPSKNGFQDIIIQPEPVGDLTSVNASFKSIYGKIAVEWKKENGIFMLKTQIPVNCRARIYLPGDKEPKWVNSGQYEFSKEY